MPWHLRSTKEFLVATPFPPTPHPSPAMGWPLHRASKAGEGAGGGGRTEVGDSRRRSSFPQHRPQRPKRVDTLAAIVVVGVDQHDLGLLLQELQPGEPFFELAIRIGVIVSLPRLIMVPPLARIASVEPDVGDAAGGLRLRRHQALQARFVDAAEPQAEHLHALERSRLDPATLTELDD